MSYLQQVTDYAVLAFISLMILALVSFIIAVIIIKHKIIKTKHTFENKLDIVANIPYITKYIYKVIKQTIK